MSSTTSFLLVISFWLLVYIRRHYVLSSTKKPLLPVPSSVRLQRASPMLWTLGHYAEVDLVSPFILRGRTMLFVDSHGDLLEILGGAASESPSPSRRRSAKSTGCWGCDWGSIVKAFYNLGSVTAIVGQTLAVGVLWWSLLQLGLLLGSSDPNTTITHNLVKRRPLPVPQSLSHSPNKFLLRPLVSSI